MMRLLTTTGEGYFGSQHAPLCDESQASQADQRLLPFPSSSPEQHRAQQHQEDDSGDEDVDSEDYSEEELEEPQPVEPDWQEERDNKLKNIFTKRRSMGHSLASSSNHEPEPKQEVSTGHHGNAAPRGLRERERSGHARSRSNSGDFLAHQQPRRQRSSRQLMAREREREPKRGRGGGGGGAGGVAPRHAPARRTKSMDHRSTWQDDSIDGDDSEPEPRPGRRPSAHGSAAYHPRSMQRNGGDNSDKDRRRKLMKRKSSLKSLPTTASSGSSLKRLADLEDSGTAIPVAGDEISIDDTVQLDNDGRSKGRSARPSCKRDLLRKSQSDKADRTRTPAAPPRNSSSSNSNKYDSQSLSKIQRMKELGEKHNTARQKLQQGGDDDDDEISLEELQRQETVAAPPQQPSQQSHHNHHHHHHGSKTIAGIGSLANLHISRANGSSRQDSSFDGSWNASADGLNAAAASKQQAKSHKERSRK